MDSQLEALDYQLIDLVQGGLPIVARPYAVIAQQLALNEQQVLQRLARLKTLGLIKRWGVVVKHRQLGYQANAMIVLDVPDEQVTRVGQVLSQQNCVNLCYQRPRQGHVWPYNVYCMIHGKDRDWVLRQWAELRETCGLTNVAAEVLFSRRCFKQRGAIYRSKHTEDVVCG